MPEYVSLASMIGKIKLEKNPLKRLIYIFHKIARRVSSKIGLDYELMIFKLVAQQIENKYKFDYIASCQELVSTYFVSCFKRTPKIAWFRSEYSVYKNQLSAKELGKEQIIYNLFDKIVCVSKTTRDDFAKYFPNIKNRIFAIHNIQFVDNIIKKSKEKIEDCFPKETFNIVSIGRFAPQKRFSQIPRIASFLKNQNIKFIWHIIGDGNMHGEYDKTISEIDHYNVGDCVICHGSKLNPYPYISMADLMITPSFYEACPRVVIESKILHTPVICADFSSAKEFIDNDVDGYVIPLEDIPEYTARMIMNRELYQRIKRECDKYFINNDIIYEQLKMIFE